MYNTLLNNSTIPINNNTIVNQNKTIVNNTIIDQNNSTNINNTTVDYLICFGISNSNISVCNGHGSCISENTCKCKQNSVDGYWSGSNCSSCLSSYGGNECLDKIALCLKIIMRSKLILNISFILN
ncbi:hypothetical protein ABK040_004194 [Willaertia magna]